MWSCEDWPNSDISRQRSGVYTICVSRCECLRVAYICVFDVRVITNWMKTKLNEFSGKMIVYVIFAFIIGQTENNREQTIFFCCFVKRLIKIAYDRRSNRCDLCECISSCEKWKNIKCRSFIGHTDHFHNLVDATSDYNVRVRVCAGFIFLSTF